MWSTVGGDWGNTRYSTLNQITTQNVTRLGGAWMSQKLDPNAASRATPVVKNGLMFVTAGPTVRALDAKTGATIWTFQAGKTSPPTGIVEVTQGSPAREGVAVGEGLIFVGMSDAHVIVRHVAVGAGSSFTHMSP